MKGFVHPPQSLRLTVVAGWLLLQLACMPPPPINDENHEGWPGPDCFAADCHARDGMPLFHDGTMQSPRCAECHGGNGACRQRDVDEHTHSDDDDCIECHENNHGYAVASDCRSCHLAEAGTRDCPVQ